MVATEDLLQGATQVISSLSANYTAGSGTLPMAAALVDHGGSLLTGAFEILVGRNRPASERRYFVATVSGTNLLITASPGYTDDQNFVTGDQIDVISAWETQRRLRAFARNHTHEGSLDGTKLPAQTPTTHGASHALGATDPLQTPSTPTTQAFGDAAASGAGTKFAADTHKHGMPANPVGTPSTWTPTMAQGVSLTFTTVNARSIIIGKFALIQMAVTFTNTGTGGSVIVVTLPAGLTLASNGATCVGVFIYNDISTTIYVGGVLQASGTTLEFLVSGNANFLGATPNLAVAVGDTLNFDLMVELA